MLCGTIASELAKPKVSYRLDPCKLSDPTVVPLSKFVKPLSQECERIYAEMHGKFQRMMLLNIKRD